MIRVAGPVVSMSGGFLESLTDLPLMARFAEAMAGILVLVGARLEQGSRRRPRPMATPRYPSLYQINTRPWLTGLSRRLRRTAILDDMPDAELNHLADLGFDWVWFRSVWQTGAAGQQVSRSRTEWRAELHLGQAARK